jgi:plasmid stability protein
MKNLTLKIDDETYQNARVRAAERGSSISAMVREYLRSLPTESEDEAQRRIVATLRKIYAEASFL